MYMAQGTETRKRLRPSEWLSVLRSLTGGSSRRQPHPREIIPRARKFSSLDVGSMCEHDRIPRVTALSQFLDHFPAYSSTSALDELRAAEYGRLDAQGQVYLDYTGGGLHADSQVREHTQLLG